MKRTLALILVVLLSVSMLAGCGGGDKGPTGKYVLTVWEIDGQDFIALMKSLGGDAFDPSTIYIEFQNDGKFTMEMDEDDASGTFKVDGKNLTLTMDGETLTGTVDGNKVTIETTEDGSTMKMVFEKK